MTATEPIEGPIVSTPAMQQRAVVLYNESLDKTRCHTDRMFAKLMVVQWLAGIAAAIWITPTTWIGATSEIHWHVWAAIFLGGAIAAFPVFLTWKQPDRPFTRHTIAFAQMLTSALLIHLTGGRIETHFHVFGSLAFLAFYRDWKVLLTATIVVAVNHFLRGIFWPQSVFGILTPSPWRWLEHAGWVIFEDIFLFISIRNSLGEMMEVSLRRARVEGVNVEIEQQVAERTTELRAAHAELQASNERFHQLADNIHEVFWITDPVKNQTLFLSPAYAKIWGRPCENAYNLATDWREAIHPDDRPRILAEAGKRMQGDYDETYRITRPDGSVRWIHECAFPLRNETGAIYRLVGTAEDITGHHQLEDQLRQTQKMKAIGTLAGGIAHDFNNILGAMNGYTQLAKISTKDPAVVEYLDTVLQAGTRAADLVKQILTFSRQEEPKRQSVKLQEVLSESLALLRATLPTTIEFRISLADDASAVMADSTQVHQIVMNLGTNAWHAMNERAGILEIKLEDFLVDSTMADTHLGLRPGEYVRLSVSDTGCGMDRATLERIFEPFFTTKPSGEGTGLGLSVVHGIMQGYGGLITVYSQPNEGTVFHLYFPAYRGKASTATGAAEPVPTGQGQRILFVDDEEMLARLGKKNLEHLGYAVEAHTAAVAALQAVRSHPQNYDLIITDQTMPGMTGAEFAACVLQIRPDMPIILTSGYSANLTPDRIRALGIRHLLPKPHTLQSLAAIVYQVLAESAAKFRGPGGFTDRMKSDP